MLTTPSHTLPLPHILLSSYPNHQVKPGCDLYHVLYKIPYLLKAPATTSKSTAPSGSKQDIASSSSSSLVPAASLAAGGGQGQVAAAVIDPSKPLDVALETFLHFVSDAADR